MSLLVHSGSAASDFQVAGTKRDDISDVLAASLYIENNMLGLTIVGEETADLQTRWTEDALNQYKITDTAGQSAGSTALTVSASDAGVLDTGYLLQEDLAVGSGEIIQVVTVNGTAITITRGYGGTTATTHAASAVWRIINAPTYQNSDLGKDKSRARLAKSNWINRFELNVNIDSEQIERSRRNYIPGVRDELGYQFLQRLLEMKRQIQQAYWFSIPATSPTGGDYSTFWGLWKWLDTSANATASFISTAEPLTDVVLNTMVKNVFRQGGFSQVAVGGPNVIEKIGQLYSDRIRIEPNDRGRGFYAQYFTPSMANPHRLVNDPYLNDTSGSAMLAVLDMNKIRLRPYVGQMFYTIKAPTFRDGQAIRALAKLTLEVRNSGTDTGFTHQGHSNLSL